MIKFFRQKIDNYIFDKIVEGDFGLNAKDKKYLEKISSDKNLIEILTKVEFAITKTSLSASTEKGIQRRNHWIECIAYLKTMIREGKKSPTINRLINEKIN